MTKDELGKLREKAFKSIKSTEHVQVEYVNNGYPGELYKVNTKIHDYKLQFTILDNIFVEFTNRSSGTTYDTVHDYFVDLMSDNLINGIIDYENEIKSNPEITEEERIQLHNYLREFYISFELQLTKVAEDNSLTLDELFS